MVCVKKRVNETERECKRENEKKKTGRGRK